MQCMLAACVYLLQAALGGAMVRREVLIVMSQAVPVCVTKDRNWQEIPVVTVHPGGKENRLYGFCLIMPVVIQARV